MNQKLNQFFDDYNLDHIVVALPVQAVTAGVLVVLLHTSLLVGLISGAAVASWGFYCRELAQYEYHLEQTVGYDPHIFWNARFWLARNPFIWPQRWDFFAPTLAVIGTTLLWDYFAK